MTSVNGKIMVGLSGGVDSAVTALLLQREGHDVEALFMKNWEEDDTRSYCAAAEDLADAEAVCERLGITLHTVNFASEYWEQVFEQFLQEHRDGRTPNPDVWCNREIKFNVMTEHAATLGATQLATGHYARLHRTNDELELLRGADPGKDQSYFLHRLTQSQLQNALFPLGELSKGAVRSLAKDAKLPVSDKKDSTGICFIGERNFTEFLQRYLPAQPGPIVSDDGEQLGEHQGLMFHTIGQRKGLAIGGLRERSAEPWYVVEKRCADNTLVVAQGSNHPLLYRPDLSASDVHWIAKDAPALPLRCSAQIRYRQQPLSCEVQEAGGDALKVLFDEPVRAVTPGQNIVFYDQQHCLGGAVIE